MAAASASGTVLRLDEPLSLWGGFDPADGTVVEVHHPQAGRSLSGRVLVVRSGRGSSSSSSVLLEAIRAGTAPAAILLAEPDGMLALGSIAAGEVYGRTIPVVVMDGAAWSALDTGDEVLVGEDGSVAVRTGRVEDQGP